MTYEKIKVGDTIIVGPDYHGKADGATGKRFIVAIMQPTPNYPWREFKVSRFDNGGGPWEHIVNEMRVKLP